MSFIPFFVLSILVALSYFVCVVMFGVDSFTFFSVFILGEVIGNIYIKLDDVMK